MVFSLFRRRSHPAARDLYEAIVAQARQEAFYTSLAVADTVTGRFDMIALHAIVLFRRLKEEDATCARAQEVFDVMFADMDASLREMGIGDTGVPKKVKKMAELFYGAADAYIVAIDDGSDAALCSALSRNVYPGIESPPVEPLAAYVRASASALAAQETPVLVAGKVTWLDPAPFARAQELETGVGHERSR